MPDEFNYETFKEYIIAPLSRQLSQRMDNFEQRIMELRSDFKENSKQVDTAFRVLADPVTGIMSRAEIINRFEKQAETIDQNRKDAEKALSAQSKWAIGGIIAVLFQVIQFMAQLLTTGHLHI